MHHHRKSTTVHNANKKSSELTNEFGETWKLLNDVRSDIRNLEEKLLTNISQTSAAVGLKHTNEHSEDMQFKRHRSRLYESSLTNGSGYVSDHADHPHHSKLAKKSYSFKDSTLHHPRSHQASVTIGELDGTIQGADPSFLNRVDTFSPYHYHTSINLPEYKPPCPYHNHHQSDNYLNNTNVVTSKFGPTVTRGTPSPSRSGSVKFNRVEVYIPDDQHQQSQVGVKSGHHPRSASEEQQAFRFDGGASSSRVLHKESDLLPASQQYANKLSTKTAPAYATETPVMITKRHLASTAATTSYDKSNEINAAKIVAASVIRKTAKSASSKIDYMDQNEPLDSVLSHQLAAKKLKKSSELIHHHHHHHHAYEASSSTGSNLIAVNNTYSLSGRSQVVGASVGSQQPTNPTSIITASSWRVGEALAQKHIKHQQVGSDNKDNMSTIGSHRSSSVPNNAKMPSSSTTSASSNTLNKSSPVGKKIKKPTSSMQDYHLIPPSSAITSSIRSKLSAVTKLATNSSSPQQSKTAVAKSKPYDSSEVQQFMRNQKLKKLYDADKDKRAQDEERRRKLNELSQKQQQRTAPTLSITINNSESKTSANIRVPSSVTTPVTSMQIKKSSPQNISANNNSGNSSDISKAMSEKINNLLNDNDKEQQRQRKYLRPITNTLSNHDNENDESEYFDSNEIATSRPPQIPPRSSSMKAHIRSDQSDSMGPPSGLIINKHDRIQKICTLALDVQDKLKLTKRALFGANLNEDEFMKANLQSRNVGSFESFATSTRHGEHIEDYDDDQRRHGDIGPSGDSTDPYFFVSNRDKFSSFERKFKQQLQDERSRLKRQFDQDARRDDDMSNDDENRVNFDDTELRMMMLKDGKVPGVGNLNEFARSRSNVDLTPDLAARRIQAAFRLYSARSKKRRLMQSSYVEPKPRLTVSSGVLKKPINEPISHQPSSKYPNSKFESFLYKSMEKDAKDQYSFINVYSRKKQTTDEPLETVKQTTVQTSLRPAISGKQKDVMIVSSRVTTVNYNDEFMTATAATASTTLDNHKSTIMKQVVTAVSNSTSNSSSESTSLSKYISNQAKTSGRENSSKSGSKKTGNYLMDDAETNMSSSSSSSSDSSNSSSSTLNAVDSKPKTAATTSSAFAYKTSIYKEPDTSAHPRRYSPNSLENLFNVNINYLDTLNMSAMQLDELDKIRTIGLAQQETVTLAHLLKEKSNALIAQQRLIAQKHKNRSQSAHTHSAATTTGTASSSPSRSSSLSSSSSHSSSNTTLNNEKEQNADYDTTTDTIKTDSAVKKQKQQKLNQRGNVSNRSKSHDNYSTFSEIHTDKRYSSFATNDEDEELEKSFRQLLPSESHLKKSKESKDQRDQSIYDLSQSSFSQLDNIMSSRLSFEDESFKKFTGEMLRKYMQEDELRHKHQAYMLKLREKALADKTKTSLAVIEQMKKKARDKGQDDKMPSILLKEKGVIQRLKQEQDDINKMREEFRRKEKQLKQQGALGLDFGTGKDKALSTIVSEDTENSISTATTGGAASSSATTSATVTEDDEPNDNNQSLIDNKFMKQVKHLNSEKYLTEREKKLLQRRRKAEEVLAWKKKLDDEELKVKEIEKQASRVLSEKAATKKQSPTKKQHQTSKQQPPPIVLIKSRDDDNDDIKTELASNRSDQAYTETFASHTKTKKSIKTDIQTATLGATHDDTTTSIRTNLDEDAGETNTQIKTNLSPSRSNSSSLSESSSTTSSTANTNFSTQERVKSLTAELMKKKAEVERLQQTLKNSKKAKLREEEDNLRKKIEQCDKVIEQIKSTLETEQDNQQKKTKPAASTSPVKKKVKEESSRKSVSSIKTSLNSEDENNKTEKEVEDRSDSSRKSEDESDRSEKVNDDKYKLKKIDDPTSSSASSSSSSTDSSSTSSISTKLQRLQETLSGGAASQKNTIKIDDKTEEKSSSTSASSESDEENNDVEEEQKQPQESEKYDDESFTNNTSKKKTTSVEEDEKPAKSESESKSPRSKSNHVFKAPETVVAARDDDDKNTLSEISEQIIADESEKHSESETESNTEEEVEKELIKLIRPNSKDDEDAKSSSSSSSSLELPPPVKPKPETPRAVVDTKNDKMAEKIENILLNQAIEQVLQVRDHKLVNLSDDENNSQALESTQKHPSIPLIDLNNLEDTKKSVTPAPPQPSIPYTREKVSALCDMAVEDYYWSRLNNLKSIIASHNSDPDSTKIFSSSRDSTLDAFFTSGLDLSHLTDEEEKTRKTNSERQFKRMLLDLIGELLLDMFIERYEKEEQVNEFVPCLKRKIERKHFKTLPYGVMDKAKTKEIIRNKVLQMMKLQEEESTTGRRGGGAGSGSVNKSKWKMSKKLDLVDSLLDKEMREQEFEWANYEIEEYEAKLLTSNHLCDMLLKETIDSFKAIFAKKINLIK